MTKLEDIDIPSFSLLKEKYKGKEFDKIKKLIEEEDYPVQYLIGDVPFLGATIKVDERVLIPRPETELLVSKVNDMLKGKTLNVLDLCTGSGAIIISLLKNNKNLSGTGVDISSDALELAKENARLNEVEVSFIKQDVLKPLELSEKYDVLISNPPYVRQNEETSPNTKYEPSIAIYEPEELIFYKRIIEYSHMYLNEKNIIAFEIGKGLEEDIMSLARKYYKEAKIYSSKDFTGINRYVFIINE